MPHAAVGYYAYQSYDTIETVFADEEPNDVLEPVEIASAGDGGPVTLLPVLASSNGTQVRIRNANEALPEEAGPPWKQRGRLNVLLLGADAGPGPRRDADRHDDRRHHRDRDRAGGAVLRAPQPVAGAAAAAGATCSRSR